MDRLEAMEAFVAVADLKGFAQAARQLKQSPPRITRLVAALEERLGVELFRRTTRVVSLTDSGAQFLGQARGILEAMRDAERATSAQQTVPSGRLVVSAPLMFGRIHVAPLFSRFLERYPAVRGELILVDRVVNLVEEGVDLAVRIGQLDDSSLKSRLLGATRRVVVASPQYFTRKSRPKKPDDLLRHSTIEVSPLVTNGWRFSKGRRALTVRPTPAFTTNSADAAIEHAVRGGGLVMVLAYQVVSLLEAGRLEVVLPGFEPEPRPIQLVYPAARHPSATVRAFVDLAAQGRQWNFVKLRHGVEHAP